MLHDTEHTNPFISNHGIHGNPRKGIPCIPWFKIQLLKKPRKETNQMKLTKTQIKEKRSELVDVLLKIEKLKD